MAKKELTVSKGGGKGLAKAGAVRDALAKYAKDESAREPAGAGGDYISIRGKEFKFKGDTMESPMKVIILDYSFENSFYIEKFDPNNPAPPACFALSMNEGDMAPHESSPEQQHETCKGCPKNEWKSADQGNGKACKNQRRLVLLNADVDDLTPDYINKAKTAMLRLPPTSLPHFRGHMKKLTDGLKIPLFAAVTELSFDEDEAHPVVRFQFVDEINDKKLIQALETKREDASSSLLAAPDVSGYEDRKPSKGKTKQPAKKQQQKKSRF